MFRGFILFYIILITFVFSQTIETKSNKWNLVGTSSDISNLENISFNNGDAIWQYNNGTWSCYRHGANYITTGVCTQTTSLNAGEGFWIYSFHDNNITINTMPNSYEKNIQDTWTLFTPVTKDYNISETFTADLPVDVIWGYDNNWTFWDENNTTTSYTKLNTLEINKGYWLYNPTNTQLFLSDNSIDIGDDKAILNDGNFSTVTKSTSDDVQNIWDVNLSITPSTEELFKIGVRITKANGAFGDIVFHNVKILSNGTLVNPDKISVYGKNSAGNTGGLILNDTMRNNSLVYSNGKLLIKLGYIMKNQTNVSESSFTAVSTYDLSIRVDNAIIFNHDTSQEAITLYDEYSEHNIAFDQNSSVIFGKININ